jgi:polysaccharide export outer membrane protein
MTGSHRFVPALIALAMLPAAVLAQSPDDWRAGQLYATRAQLQDMLARYEAGSNASAYSDAVRSIAGDEAELIRLRLENGDFEVGDVISLTVVGQPTLSTDFTVAPGYLLILPEVGQVELRGVLRSELREHMTRHLAKYLHDPQVVVQTKVNIQVWGDVRSPGYYTVTAESRLTDILVTAGQPNQTAKLDKMKVKRSGDTIWDGDELELAIIQGRTLDQLNLRAGDMIEVPGKTNRNWTDMLRAVYYIVPLSFAISRIF